MRAEILVSSVCLVLAFSCNAGKSEDLLKSFPENASPDKIGMVLTEKFIADPFSPVREPSQGK